MNLLNPVFVPHGLTARGLRAWAARSYRAFYLRPSVVARYIRGIRGPSQVVQLARGAFALLFSLARARGDRDPGAGDGSGGR
jgi:hypothetical protein